MIGIFDSGFGGLTILKAIRRHLPQYDYLYLGDNARSPYGSRSFEVVYSYTLQAVNYLFGRGCRLVILACNTASAKALRTIQQNDLPYLWEERGEVGDDKRGLERVLGVIRPTVEALAQYTKSGHVGVLATEGTVASESYPIEITKLFPHISVHQQACPMWVPLIENAEHESAGADYFVGKYLEQILTADERIDTLLLACTHYPLLLPKIETFLSRWTTSNQPDRQIRLLTQGDIVAVSLADYLSRHPSLLPYCGNSGRVEFLTTESEERFARPAAIFMGEEVAARHVELK